MHEGSDLCDAVCTALERALGDGYECRAGECLAYDLRHDPSDSVVEQSFETDVAVFEDDVPRLVVAVEDDDPTTRDLVVVDDEARRHKRTQPFLRYGMAAFGSSGGTARRYLWHTDALDFCFVSERTPADPGDFRDDELSRLVHVVRRNLETSYRLERVLDGGADHVTMNRAVQFSFPSRGPEPVESPIPPRE